MGNNSRGIDIIPCKTPPPKGYAPPKKLLTMEKKCVMIKLRKDKGK
jgi:hypothetical protein